jgi:hypothetical protein
MSDTAKAVISLIDRWPHGHSGAAPDRSSFYRVLNKFATRLEPNPANRAAAEEMTK